MEKLFLQCLALTYHMQKSSRFPLLKLRRTSSAAGLEHRRRHEALCMLSETWRQLWTELLAKRFKEKRGRINCSNLDSDPDKAKGLWWIKTTPLAELCGWYGMVSLRCHHAELKSCMLGPTWSNECLFHSVAAPLKVSSHSLRGECRILLIIITDYCISYASHWKPVWKDIEPHGATATTWIPKYPSKGCIMVRAGSFWSTPKPWLFFFFAKNH